MRLALFHFRLASTVGSTPKTNNAKACQMEQNKLATLTIGAGVPVKLLAPANAMTYIAAHVPPAWLWIGGLSSTIIDLCSRMKLER